MDAHIENPVAREYIDELAGDLDLHPGAKVTFNEFADWISHMCGEAQSDPDWRPLAGVTGQYVGVLVSIEDDGDPESGPHVSVFATMVVLTDDGRWVATDPKELVEYADAANELY